VLPDKGHAAAAVSGSIEWRHPPDRRLAPALPACGERCRWISPRRARRRCPEMIVAIERLGSRKSTWSPRGRGRRPGRARPRESRARRVHRRHAQPVYAQRSVAAVRHRAHGIWLPCCATSLLRRASRWRRRIYQEGPATALDYVGITAPVRGTHPPAPRHAGLSLAGRPHA